MALDPRIALAGIQPTFSLFDLGATMAKGQQLQAGRLALTEEQRSQAAAEQVRQAFAQQYGGGPPAGLAGAAPMAPPGGAPLQEQQLQGQPTAAFPGGQAPGGPQAPQGLGGLGRQLGATPGPPPGGDRAFIDKLYTLSPTAGREAERHALETEKAQFAQHLERVEYLGRVANGVLDADTQQAYDVGRQMLLQAGMPASQMPPVYDRSLMQMYAGTALDAKDRLQAKAKAIDQQLRAGELALEERREGRAETKATREEQEAGQKAPDYGYKELNPYLYERYGSILGPGERPSAAMISQARLDEQADLQEGERRKTLGKETGKLEAEKPALARKAQTQMGQLERQWQTTEEEIDSALKLMDDHPVLQQAGFWSRAVVKGTPAYDLRQKLETIRANVGFDRLQQMREASPTGGALGQVSDSENRLLQSTAGSLDPAQSPAQLRRNLERIKADVVALRTDRRRAFESDFGGRAPTSGRAPAAGAPGGSGATRATRQEFEDAKKQRPKWSEEQLRQWYRDQGIEVE